MNGSRRALLAALSCWALGCGRETPPPPPQPPAPLPPLVSAKALQERLTHPYGNIQLFDTRAESAYADGHLPGALNLPATMITLDEGAQLTSAARARLIGLLEMSGLRSRSDLVVIDDGTLDGFGRAALLCWILAIADQSKCSLLEGGTPAWIAAGSGLETERVSKPAPGARLTISTTPAEIASLKQVRAATALPNPLLLDVRSLSAGPGIPGAKRLPLGGLIPDGRYDAAHVETAVGESSLFHENELLIVGEGASDGAAAWFVLRRLVGLANVRLYPEGMNGWRRHGSLPGNDQHE